LWGGRSTPAEGGRTSLENPYGDEENTEGEEYARGTLRRTGFGSGYYADARIFGRRQRTVEEVHSRPAYEYKEEG